MKEYITIMLQKVKVEIWPLSEHIRTTFPDGSWLDAAPQDNDAYRSTAADMGYTDPWDMCREHELLHTILVAQFQGKEYSTALYKAANGLPFNHNDYVEEGLVMGIQKKFNLNTFSDSLTIRQLKGTLNQVFYEAAGITAADEHDTHDNYLPKALKGSTV